MKKLIILLAIMIFTITGCATAGEKPTKAPIPTAEQLVSDINKKIAEYDAPIAKAKQSLDAKAEWQEFLKQKAIFDEAVKAFKPYDEKTSKLKEYRRWRYLVDQQNSWKRMLEGGK